MNERSFTGTSPSGRSRSSAPPSRPTIATRTNDKDVRILQAAVSVFGRQGYHGSSIADVAREAGVATGTIYLYFKQKEELLIGVFRAYAGRYLERCREGIAQVEPGFEQFRKLLGLHLGLLAEDRDLARVFQIHLREASPVIQEGMRPALREIFELMEEVIRDGVACGHFRADVDVRTARRFLFGGVDEIVSAWVHSKREYSLTEQLGPLYAMSAQAIAAPDQAARVAAEIADS